MMRPLFCDPKMPFELPACSKQLDTLAPRKDAQDAVYLLAACEAPETPAQLEERLTELYRFVASLRTMAQPATVLILIDEGGFVGSGPPLTAALAVAVDSLVRSMAMECGRKGIRFHSIITPTDPESETLEGLITYLSGPAAQQNGGRFWLNPQASLARMMP